MTDDQAKRLQDSVDTLNRVMSEIVQADAGSTHVRPSCGFSTELGYAYVQVEVTSGVRYFT